MESPRFSVIIPLYNKEAEVARTMRSVLAQTLPPHEIVVVDDGSTDAGASVVEAFVEQSAPGAPPIRLIRQQNAGETAARNRAMAEAVGDYFALIDADDEWRPGFLAGIAAMIDHFPGCGLYSTSFDIVNTDGEHRAHTLDRGGVVDDFFRASLTAYVSIPSASVLARWVVERVGGFPEGMRLGGDQYMWTKVALAAPVCFSPTRLVRYHMAASNRSAAIYRPEETAYGFEDFFDPAGAGYPRSSAFWLDEYIARVALGKAIVISAKGGTGEGLGAEKFFSYNRHSRRLWWRLWVLNRLPKRVRGALNALYGSLAWRLARRGL